MIQSTCPYCISKSYSDAGLINCEDLFCKSKLTASYFECNECQSWYQRDLPDNISGLYDAYAIHRKKPFYFKLLRAVLGFNGYLKCPDQYLQKRISLLDYGCGDGGYLEWIRGVGNKVGLDPFNPRFISSFENSNRYDLITLNHVFEHLQSPYETIRGLRDKLNDDGYLLILIPNKDSFLAQNNKRLWHGLDSPRHLHLASIDGIKKLCERSDFDLVNIEEFTFPNDLSATYVQVLFGRYNKILFYLFLIPSILFSQIKIKRNRSLIRFILKKK